MDVKHTNEIALICFMIFIITISVKMNSFSLKSADFEINHVLKIKIESMAEKNDSIAGPH